MRHNLGNLQFNMVFGACGQRDNAEIFICFPNRYDDQTSKTCYRSSGINDYTDGLKDLTELPQSIHRHRSTRIGVTSGESHYIR